MKLEWGFALSIDMDMDLGERHNIFGKIMKTRIL